MQVYRQFKLKLYIDRSDYGIADTARTKPYFYIPI